MHCFQFIQMETLWSWLFPTMRRRNFCRLQQTAFAPQRWACLRRILSMLAARGGSGGPWAAPGKAGACLGLFSGVSMSYGKISYGKFLECEGAPGTGNSCCLLFSNACWWKGLVETFRNWRGHCIGGWPCPSALSTCTSACLLEDNAKFLQFLWV